MGILEFVRIHWEKLERRRHRHGRQGNINVRGIRELVTDLILLVQD
jgi:hypothetical protein